MRHKDQCLGGCFFSKSVYSLWFHQSHCPIHVQLMLLYERRSVEDSNDQVPDASEKLWFGLCLFLVQLPSSKLAVQSFVIEHHTKDWFFEDSTLMFLATIGLDEMRCASNYVFHQRLMRVVTKTSSGTQQIWPGRCEQMWSARILTRNFRQREHSIDIQVLFHHEIVLSTLRTNTPPRQRLVDPHICSRIVSHQSCSASQRNTFTIFTCIRQNFDLDWHRCARCGTGRCQPHNSLSFSKRSRYNFLDSILWWCPFHSSYCIAQHVHHARSMRHSADCQTCNRCQHHRPDLNESLVSTRRSQHHRDSQLTKWWIWTHHSQSHMNDPNFPTLLLGRLVDFVKSGVWSRQKVKRMFGTTISVVDSAWQVNNEEAMCECHEEKASFGIRSSVSCTPDSRRDQFCLQSWCVPYIHSSHNGLLDDVVRKVFALLSKRVQVWDSSGILHISNSSSLVDVCSWSCFGRNVYGSSASVLFCCAICCWSQRRVEARARLVAGCCLLSYLRCIISRARCPVGRIAQGR